MILIPIGHDQGELRRRPAVTFTIIAICCAVAFAQYDMERGRTNTAKESLSEAVKYYAENPDLTPPPELKDVFDRILAAEDAGARRAMRESMEEYHGDAQTRPERQQKLDALTEGWLEPMRDNTIWRWGLIPADFSWLELVTSMFVHAGFLHLLFNMLFLYMTGPFIEDVWGRPLFLAFYLTGGMVAGGMFALQDRDVAEPLIGASGAVAAVMGAFLIRYPRAKIRLLTFLLWRRIVFSAPAWLVISLWFLGEYAEARATMSHTPIGGSGMRVANWAHVWGFAYGAAVAAVIHFLRIEDRFLFDAIEDKRIAARDPLQNRVDELLTRGNGAEACRVLASELLRRPNDAALADTYWELARGGPMKTQPSVCLRIIESDLQQRKEDRALERWLELRTTVPAMSPDPHLAVRLAQCLVEHGRRAEAEEMVVDCYRRLGPSSPPHEWAELAKYCVSSGSPITSQVVSRALAHPRLPQDARDALEQTQRLRIS